VAIAAALLGLVLSPSLLAATPAVDAAFARFWRAASPGEAAAATEAILTSDISFDDALARLKNGRPYSPGVPKGIVRQSHRLGTIDFPYVLDVPESYDPARKYAVRVQLHGGVGRPDGTPRGNGIGALAAPVRSRSTSCRRRGPASSGGPTASSRTYARSSTR
jgi:hypothetical protein